MEKLIRAAILGHAVGDALGVPAEFISRSALERDPVTGMRGGGVHGQAPGTWSDDTSMLLCTLASLTKHRPPDPEDIMAQFSRWAKTGYMTPYDRAFGVGRSTLKALGNYWRGRKPYGPAGEQDCGNGSLMRVLPVALWAALDPSPVLSETERLRCIDTVSALTHGHPVPQMACRIYSCIAAALVRQPDHSGLQIGMDAAQALYSGDPTVPVFSRLFSPDFSATPRHKIRSTGYVVDTLEAALWCFMTTESYRDCVLKAVNLGDDADTTAAVAGGLAGLMYGEEAIPGEWLGMLPKRKQIETLCADFAAAL